MIINNKRSNIRIRNKAKILKIEIKANKINKTKANKIK